MSGMGTMDKKAAVGLFASFTPMFSEFERKGIDYCLVGGLAVVAHCLTRGEGSFRATLDADAMVPPDYSNADFARDYLNVYAADPAYGRAVYEALLGEGGFAELTEPKMEFVNASFVGADLELDGVDTPDFDVCRVLNGRTLADLERERLFILGNLSGSHQSTSFSA